VSWVAIAGHVDGLCYDLVAWDDARFKFGSAAFLMRRFVDVSR
jgi:hypothetical protein